MLSQIACGCSAACKESFDNTGGVKQPFTDMIKNFRNKGLRAFWESADAHKLQVQNRIRVLRLLRSLDDADQVEDMNLPGYKFHGLRTDPKRWSIWVTGNYRITFAWDEGAIDVDIEDDH